MNSQNNLSPEPTSNAALSRRSWLSQAGLGMGGFALSCLLKQQSAVAAMPSGATNPLAAKVPHFAPRAKSVIFLMMEGGPSQVDTFDPKPILNRLDGKLFQRENVKTNQVKGRRLFVRSPFNFKKHGQSGIQVSELFEQTAAHVDEMAVIRSAYGDSDNHPAAVFQYTTGFPIQGNPSIGSWVIYGLGTENNNLPSFVVLRDGKPFGGTTAWGNGFLSALYQGVQFRSGKKPVLNLEPPQGITQSQQSSTLQLLKKLNEQHQKTRAEFSDLEARIASYDLAFRMQREIPETIDLAQESATTHKLYGIDNNTTKSFGERCLLARRLVERGVRFVQLWSGGWDSHANVRDGHRAAAARVDRPIAGLLQDLKQRGLLNETLVMWGGEFGRTADTREAAYNQKQPGRDHNPKATPIWFAGGGVRGGTIIGATDEFGDRATEQRYHLRDVHATLLHLLGLEQEDLTFYHGGRLKRLTENGGEIIEGLLS